MHFSFPYAHETVELDLPDRNLAFYVHRNQLPASNSVSESITEAMRHPYGIPSLAKLASGKDRIIVLVDDLTRPTPLKKILPTILEQLCTEGSKAEKIKIIIGLGTHRPMSDTEIKEHLGQEIVENFTIANHDFKDDKKLINLGTTELGIPAIVNREVVDADFVLSVGNIVPHNAAGWGGGAKMILPGVSGEESVGRLHIAAGRVRPIAGLVATLDNPMRHDITAIGKKAGLKAIVNTVLNNEDEVVQVVAGEPEQAFNEGVKTARNVFCQRVSELADIIIFSTYPADIDYWQAMKALDFAHVGVKKGGTIILLTPCPERISPTHSTFGQYATKNYKDITEAIENKTIKDLPAAGALLMHAQIREHANIICCSTGLTEEDTRALGFERASTIDDAVRMAIMRHGDLARVGVLECGEVVPVYDPLAQTSKR
ncbi:MAG TPA: nickel-dependent lactate racemase [Candidatus Acidoferrum sp.]|nr:nickel-dependent lactate racemase [Candidatus Acidoferrum sp.]